MEGERNKMEKKFEEVKQLRNLIEEFCRDGEKSLEKDMMLLSLPPVSEEDAITISESSIKGYKERHLEHIKDFESLYAEAVDSYILDKGFRMKVLFQKAIKVRNLEKQMQQNELESISEINPVNNDGALTDEVIEKMIEEQNKASAPEEEFIPVFSWLTENQMKRWQDILEKSGLLTLN
ncbi:MAG: hypothetical protein HYT15_02830 [Candidatus Magasanikbacteria bacterium]|nr:hypothetical protein [Candidatus Magasanikbacteria bacterium]